MNLYGLHPGMYHFDFSDPTIFDSLSRSYRYLDSSMLAAYEEEEEEARMVPKKPATPPKQRHDGTSPLPFGMDWSPPPRKWDGRDSVWPHDPLSGWSYCVTIPSWIIMPKSSRSDPVVFYRVQIGIQSPQGITTTRGILRRFSDFLKLFSELKTAFPRKNLPPAPPKRLLKTKSRTVMAERRCLLEDWMEKVLSDIDLSRSATVAIFLELEAAARSSFYDSYEPSLDSNSLGGESVSAVSSSVASDCGNYSSEETSEVGTPTNKRDDYSEAGMENRTFDQVEFTSNPKHLKNNGSRIDSNEANGKSIKAVSNVEGEPLSRSENPKLGAHLQRLSTESIGSDVCYVRAEISSLGVANSSGDNSLDLESGAEIPNIGDDHVSSDLGFARDLLVALPSDERNKMNRVLNNLHQRLTTAKTDMEDLIARLNQELAVRQYLTTKVKDLEVDLDTMKHSSKENLQQAVLIERERFTQMQWDMEELRRKCIEMELKLKSEQDEKVQIKSAKLLVSQENETLRQNLHSARKQMENSQKHNENQELKLKTDVKLLAKEVKSLQSSQSELKHELSSLMKEKIEVERELLMEKESSERSKAANTKLLQECEILRGQLEECSVNFHIKEENKLVMDALSPSDAADLLMTSDNRIGLLLAEAQLLVQDIENATAAMTSNGDDGDVRAREHFLRKMLTDVFVDNARLRKQVNSVIRCVLSTTDGSDEADGGEEPPSRKTVLGKYL